MGVGVANSFVGVACLHFLQAMLQVFTVITGGSGFTSGKKTSKKNSFFNDYEHNKIFF